MVIFFDRNLDYNCDKGRCSNLIINGQKKTKNGVK